MPLTSTKDVLIGSAERKGISGGQRKRVNMGQELLTEPSVLLLDEPTSGLDPKSDYDVMVLLKDISQKGKIVMLTTHNINEKNFSLMTHLVILARGGKLAYFGPTSEAAAYFGVNEPEAIFNELPKQNPQYWQNKYKESRYYRDYVVQRKTTKSTGSFKTHKIRNNFSISQYTTLISRYWKIKCRDVLGSLILLMQAPIIALLLLLVFRDEAKQYGNLLFIGVIAAIWCGCSNAAREIVNEITIFKRERMVNLNVFAYLFSKMTVLSLLCFVQCLVIAAAILTYFSGLEIAFVPLMGILLLASFAAMLLGLLISTISKTSEAAMALVPIAVIPQVVLAGIVSIYQNMHESTQWLADLAISRWATQAIFQQASIKVLDISMSIHESTNCFGKAYSLEKIIFILLTFSFIYFGITALILKNRR